MSDPFVLGVNYWPRRKAMYWWNNFDAGEVREEFSLICELGLNIVRIFLLWDDFQPEPDKVALDAMKHLITVADIAADNGLGLRPDLFHRAHERTELESALVTGWQGSSISGLWAAKRYRELGKSGGRGVSQYVP